MSSTSSQPPAPPAAIILAAGKGTRMAGPVEAGAEPGAGVHEVLPKVAYEVAGKPMVWWVVQACREAGVKRMVVVIGYRGNVVRNVLADFADCEFVEQKEQLGTGHAAKMAEPLFLQAKHDPASDVFVLAGDGPLIRAATLKRLLEVHQKSAAAATLATAIIPDPTGYGRVLRDATGGFQAIIEHKDASDEQKKIREINPSYYCFKTADLFATLNQVKNSNRQGEYYLTDVPAILQREGKKVMVVDAVPPEDVLSINTPAELKVVDGILRNRMKAEVVR